MAIVSVGMLLWQDLGTSSVPLSDAVASRTNAPWAAVRCPAPGPAPDDAMTADRSEALLNVGQGAGADDAPDRG